MNRSPAGGRSLHAPALQARLLRAGRSFVMMAISAMAAWFMTSAAHAQVVTINETFTGTSVSSGWVLAKKPGTTFDPILTAANGIDADGSGWLRLTDAAMWEATYAYNTNAFNGANATISTTFKYASYGGNGADGMTFFLADASKTFAVGAYGGSLGYAQMNVGATQTAGMAGGYIGLGIDEYGNYSTANEGKVGGYGSNTAQGAYPNALAVRGPGDGLSGYDYLGGTGPFAAQLSFDQASRPTGADERTLQINITATNQLTVFLKQGDTGSLEELYTIDLSGFARPDQLVMGFTASTGGLTNIHEIQGLQLSSVAANLWTNGGGTSTWASSSNWDGSSGQIPLTGADILFDNNYVSTAQTIDVGGTRSIRSLQLDAPFSYTLNNGTLQFNNNGVLGPSGIFVSQGNGAATHTVNSALIADNAIEIKNSSSGALNINGTLATGGNAITLNGTGSTTLAGAISGTGGITKIGTGNTTLSASNTYSGGTTVRAGTLTVANNNALGSGDVTLRGGTLASSASNTIGNTISLQGNSGLSSLTTSGTITQTGGDYTLSMANATHSGAINLSNNNTARTLSVNVDSGTSTISGTIQNGGTAAGNFTKTGAGTLVMSGTNIYTGATNVNAGTLQLGASDVFSTNSTLNIAGGTLDLAGFSQKVGDLSFSNDGVLNFGASSGANTFVFGNIASQSGVLTVSNWENGLDNLASTTGGLNVGSIYFSGIGTAVQAGSTTSLGTYGSGYLITPGTQNWKTWLGGTNAWGTNGNWSPSGAPNGVGALALFTGTTASSTINLSANRTLTGMRFDSTAKSYTFNNGSGNRRLILDSPTAGGIAYIQQQSPNNQTFNFGWVQLNDNVVLDVTGSGNLIINSLLTGTSSLVKEGNGRVVLAGNTGTNYTGNIFINAGSMQVANAGALGTTVGTTTAVANGAALELSNAAGMTVSETLTISGSGSGNTGAIRNLSGNNTLNRAITLDDDSRINGDNDAGTAGVDTLTISNGINSANRNLTLGGSGNITISGAIALGTGGVTIDSGNTVTLSGAGDNTYSGTTTVNTGTLVLNKTPGTNVDAVSGALVIGDGTGAASSAIARLGNINQINDASAVTIASDGELDLAGRNETIGSLSGSGRVDNSAAGATTLTFGDINSTIFSGTIDETAGAGNISLVKQGPGKTTLTNASSFGGTTSLNNGILAVQATGALSTGAVTVANGANLELSNNITLANAITVNGVGTLAEDGAIQNTAGSNTLTGAITLASSAEIQSDAGTLILSGAGNITGSGGTRDITFDGAGDINVSKIVGTNIGEITKNGTGTLTLSAANTYSGATTINAGNLVASGGSAIGNTSAVTVASGATFTSAANNETIGSLAGAGTVALGTGSVTLTAGGDNSSTTFSGAFTGGASTTLQKSGTGTLTLSGASGAMNGNVSLTGGTLSLANASGAALGGVSNITVGTGTTLALGASDQINDAATLTLAGGTFNVGGFSETMRSVSQTAASSIDFLNDGSVLQFNGVNGVSSGLGTIAGGTLTIANWAGSLGGGGTEQFVIYSPSAPTLTNINFANWGTGNNATAIARGDLGAGFYELVPIVAVTDWNLNGNGNWNVGGNWVGGAVPGGAGSFVRFGNLGSAAPLTTNPTVSVTANQTVGSLIFDNDANRNYTIAGGATLTLDATTGSAQIQVDDDGAHTISATTRFSDSTVVTNNSTAGTGLRFSGNVGQQNSGTLTFTGSGSTLVDGTITQVSGSTALLKTGDGTLTLANAGNTYTGTTTVRNGTLQVNANAPSGANGALGNSATAIVMNDGSTTGSMDTALVIGASGVTIGRAITVNSQGGTTTLGSNITGTGTATFSGAIALNRGVNLTAAANNTTTFSGAFTNGSGTQDITKVGAGTVVLSNAANSYNGTTFIEAGTLRLGVAGAIPNGSSVMMTGANTTFALNNISETIGSLGSSSGLTTATVSLGSATLTSGGDNTSTQFDGAITGTGGLTKIGTGTLTLAGANTFSGAVNVNTGGTLVAGSNAALGTTAGSTTVASGGTLGLQGDIAIGSETLYLSGVGANTSGALRNVSGDNSYAGTLRLTGATTIKSDSGTLTIATGGIIGDTAAQNVTFTGSGNTTVTAVVGNAVAANNITNLTKSGSGTLTLTNANLYSGTTTVDGGTLEIQNAAALGSGATATTVNTGGTLALSGGGFTISNGEDLTINGEGVGGQGSLRNLSGNNTLGAGTAVTLGSDATIGADGSSSLTISGVIAGTGDSIVKAGSGTLALNGANTYTGSTTIRNGTITTTTNAPSGAAGALGTATSTVQLGDSGTAAGDDLGFILAANAGGTSANRNFSVNNYGNTVTLGGSNTSGTNTFGGTITLNRDLTLTSATGGNVTYSNTISGNGGLVVAGTGTTNLNGTNSYTGTTTLRSGTLATTGNAPVSGNGAFGNSATALELGDAGTGANNLSLLLGNATGNRTIDRDINVNNYGNTVTIGGSNTSGTNTYSGDIALAKNVTLSTGTGGTVAFTGDVSGTGGVTASGAGTITLSGTNSYGGTTTVSSGTTLVAATSNALGSTAGGTTVNSGGTLGLQGDITIAAGENFTIGGSGVGNNGAIRSLSGDNTVAGNIALSAATTIGNSTAGTTLTVSGAMSGAQNLTTTGAGEFAFTGTNTNSGTFTLNGSAGSVVTLAGASGQALGNVSNITINAGNTLSLGAANQINDNATLTLAGGTFNVSSFGETMRSVSQNTAASTIDFLNDGSVLRFNGVAGVSSGLGTIAGGTLTIANWAGSLNGMGSEQLVIYSPTAPNLTNINFSNWGTGNNAIAIARGDLGAGFYELAPNVVAIDWNVNGNGNWTTGGNWVGGVAPNGAAVIARFGNLGSAAPLTANPTVTLTANQTVNKLLFDNSANRNYTVSGASRLDFSANALINVNDNGAHTINVAGQHAGSTTITNNSTAGTGLTIAGTMTQMANSTLTFNGDGNTVVSGAIVRNAGITNLLKTGTGTLTLSNAGNTYTGTTTLRSGTLQINASAGGTGSLGTATSAIVVNDAQTTSTMNTSLLLGANNITLSRNITVGSQGNITTLGGNFGAGMASTISGVVTLNKGVTLTAGAGNVAFTGALTAGTGSQNITKEGTGVVILSSTGNNYNGTTTINAGTLQLGVAGAVPDGSALTLAGANTTFALANFNETIGSLAGNQTTSTVNLGSATLTTGGNNTSTQYDGTITGTGQLVKNGTGTMTLTGNNAYSGATTVNAGTLVAAHNNALGTNAGSTTTAAGATVGLQGNITVTGETLNAAAAASPTAASLANLSGNNTWTGNISLTGATAGHQVGIDAAAGSQLTLSGVISQATNTKALNKTGAGTVILSGAADNTFTGGVNVNAGTLVAAKNNALGASGTAATTNVAAGATLGVQGNITIGSNKTYSLAGSAMPATTPSLQNLAGTNTLDGNILLTGVANTGVAIDSAGGSSLILNGAITQSTANNAIIKTGLGSITLAGAADNTFAGGFTINDGTVYAAKTGDKDATGRADVTIGNGDANAAALVLNGNNQIRNTSAVTVNTDGQLDLQSFNDTIGTLTMSGGSVTGTGTLTLSGTLTFNGSGTNTATISSNLNLGGDRIAQINNNGVGTDSDLTISGAVSGPGNALTKAGTGTLTLSGTNTYGTTSITGGTLQIGSGGATGTLGSLGVTNDGTLVFNRNNSYTVANAISGSGALVQNGTGTTILTGANNYGTTTITNGTLQIGDGSTTGTLGTGAVANSSALVFNRSDSFVVANLISGTGSVTKQGAGTLTLTASGPTIYSGTTTISAGTLQIGNGGATGEIGTGAISNSGTLSINRNNAYTVSGAMSGSGNFRQEGSGTTTLSANNTYTGTTTISNGTLQIGNGSTSGTLGNGTGNVINNSTLAFNRTDSHVVANNISGSGNLVQTAGTAILTGTNNYAGTTTISNGATLQIGNNTTTGTLGGNNVLNSGTLRFNRSNSISVNNVISGSGAVVNASGTTTLSGANTYSGTTTLNGGTLVIANSAGLGSTVGGTTVASGATLALSGGIAVGNESLTLQGGGTFQNLDSSNSFAGNLALSGSSAVVNSSGSLTLSGGISGAGANISFSGAGSTFLAGSISLGSGTLTNSGTMTFDSNLSFAGNLTLAGGTLNLNGADISVNTLRITGSTILDFGNSTGSSLNVNSIYIAAGATLTINNWVEWTDLFTTLGWQNNVGTDITPSVPHETPQAPPIDQIDFDGWTDTGTHWDASNEITPTPEPSTYGALLLSGLTALVWWRRRTQSAKKPLS